MLWVIFALLTGAAVFSVLWPLSRAPAEVDARELDVAFYQAQTVEIARDAGRGIIGRDEAEVARNEAARRLVAASQRQPPSARAPIVASPWRGRLVALGTLVFVPALALGLYWQIGAPNLPDQPLQARLDAAPAQMDMATAIAKIEQHLRKDPNDGRGWSILAPIYVRLRRYDDAQRAYANAIRVLGPSADRYAALGEAIVFGNGGAVVTAEAKRAFEAAVAADPASPRGNFYLGLAAQQDGDKGKAVAIWQRLIANSPPNAPWLALVRSRITEAGGTAPVANASADGPTGPMAAAVAALPAEQQQAMIHRMVDGLAQRLKANANDIEGWLRLVRAYRVLNESDKAKIALVDARRQFATDPSATKRLDDLAHELGLEG